MPLKTKTNSESEVIFIELDTEVSFYAQPCGMIVAATLALANSAASHVEIVYEKTQNQQQNQRPIVPTISHWRSLGDRKAKCEMTTEHFRFFPNQESKPSTLGNPKQVKGKNRFNLRDIFEIKTTK